MQDITLLGASYSSVPAVNLPKTGGGTARFTDTTVVTASAADVLAGKYFVDVNGDTVEGTGSGGGGNIEALTVTPTTAQQVITDIYDVIVTINRSTSGTALEEYITAPTVGNKYAIKGTISKNTDVVTVDEVFVFDGNDATYTYTVGTYVFVAKIYRQSTYWKFRVQCSTSGFSANISFYSGRMVDGFNPVTVEAVDTDTYIWPFIGRTISTFSNSTFSYIGPYAFAFCSQLRTVNISAQEIGNNAFHYCAAISNLNIPNVSKIGTEAFWMCSSTGLSTLNLPSCESIGFSAFRQCYGIEAVSAPMLTELSAGAFEWCRKLSSLYTPNLEIINTNAFCSCSSLSVVSFPKVKTIGSTAFSNTKITEITLPVLTILSANAFVGCLSLTTANIPNLQSTWNSAFAGTALTEVHFPSLTYINQFCFASCISLSIVDAPAATDVCLSAFMSCTALTSVSFSLATSVQNGVFAGCTNLSEAYLPLISSIGASLFYSTKLQSASFSLASSIGTNAFNNCVNLSYVSIPLASIISGSAFYSCNTLTSISFPNATSIGANAFRYCSALESAYFFTSTVPTLGNSAFLSTPMSLSSYLGYWGSIYVKASLLDSFKAAGQWSVYKNRMVGLTDEQIEAL